MFSVKHGLPCNISRPTALYLNSTLSAFAFKFRNFSNIQSWQFLIMKRGKWKQSPWLQSKANTATKRHKNFLKIWNIWSWAGQRVVVCPTFNDLRSLNHTRLPKRNRSIYENREIISRKEMILALLQRFQAPMVRLSLLQEAKNYAINRTFLSRI